MPATKRKKFMWTAKHRAGRRFSTEHVWTFQLYQHFVDMGKYELNMIYKFDLTRNLDGQPLQFMVKDRCAYCLLCAFPAGSYPHTASLRMMPCAAVLRCKQQVVRQLIVAP